MQSNVSYWLGESPLIWDILNETKSKVMKAYVQNNAYPNFMGCRLGYKWKRTSHLERKENNNNKQISIKEG